MNEQAVLTDYHLRMMARAAHLRQEARRLRAEGLTIGEIAVRIGRSRGRVTDYLWEPTPTLGVGTPVLTWEEKARQMAAVYPDRQRQEWIFHQLGLEYPGE